MFACAGLKAQNRQDVANFSQFKQLFNPALTGLEGTSIKNFYRDQWTSFEDAPRTLFLSGEANLQDLTKSKGDGLQHSFGISLLHDTYGALTNNNLNLSYGAGIKIADKLRLRAGIAVTYNNTKFDNASLIVADPTDPAYTSLSNNNNVKKYGVNIGVAVTSDDYYFGYSASDLVKGGDSDVAYFNDVYVLQHTVQAGYRRALSSNIGLVLNGIYRYDENMKGTAEAQLKTVFLNSFWLGAGYRNDIAYTFNTGVRFKQFKIGYSRELSSNKIANTYRGGNEITLSYNFTPVFSGAGKTLSIW
jgi:type IX secretion system PorP/SprF family membrane protein